MAEIDSSHSAARHHPALPEATGLRAVFFDFDGVILESVAIKDQAFQQLFSDHPEHLDRILKHHRVHLGHSRFEKFEWIYRELLRRPLGNRESLVLGKRFSALVEAGVLSCPMVPGARELLEALRGSHLESWVVSATPQRELESIIDQRELGKYFREVHGAPPTKTEIFATLLDRHGLEPQEVLAIGDGLSDYHAAEAAGVSFVARTSDSSHQDWSSIPVPTVSNLAELLGPLGKGSHG